MSELSLSTRHPPLAIFFRHTTEIHDLFNRIQTSSADHFNAQLDGVNWGHVGSVGHVAVQLRAIAAFMAV